MFEAAAADVDCDAWRFEPATEDRRAVVRLVPRATRSRATERQERVLRAYLRALGADCY